MPFIACADWHPGRLTEMQDLKARIAPPKQIEVCA